jgi:uncharacterized membrane protein YcaP (DUF421 family)
MTIDWRSLFVPHGSLVELVIRGSAMYLGLFTVLRVVVRREVGSFSMPDLLLVVLIADAAQNAMAGQYTSITEGAVLCGTLIGWSYLLDVLAYRFPLLRRWLEPGAVMLVRDGRVLHRNMRRELVTMEELASHLRQQGVEDVRDVQLACIEPDGQISVLKRTNSGGDEGSRTRKRRGTTG